MLNCRSEVPVLTVVISPSFSVGKYVIWWSLIIPFCDIGMDHINSITEKTGLVAETSSGAEGTEVKNKSK